MSVLADLSTLAKSVGFRKLLGVRLVSQVGDGMFQAGLASLFFFSPQSMTSAAGVAAAIVVIGRAVVRLTERGIVPPERFPLLRHLYEVVGLDQPVAVPWDSFFGGDGSGQA